MKKLWDFVEGISVYVFFAFLVWFLYRTFINEDRSLSIVVFSFTCLILVLDTLNAAASNIKGKPYKSVIGGLLENKDLNPWCHAALAAVFVLGWIKLALL